MQKSDIPLCDVIYESVGLKELHTCVSYAYGTDAPMVISMHAPTKLAVFTLSFHRSSLFYQYFAPFCPLSASVQSAIDAVGTHLHDLVGSRFDNPTSRKERCKGLNRQTTY